MNTIIISEFTDEAASKTKGLVLRTKLNDLISSGEKDISIDFSSITKFASPFFNNSLAALALIYGFSTINSIKISNISDIGLNTYQTSINNAKTVSTNRECATEINQIIDNAPKKVDK